MAAKRREAVITAGLLKKIKFPPSPKTKKRINERFDLGRNEWNNSDDSNNDFVPLKKMPKECLYHIFDKKDVHFWGFHGTMEFVFQSLYTAKE